MSATGVRWVPRLIGVAVTLVIVAGVEWLQRTRFAIPDPTALFLLAIACAALVGGMLIGLVCAAISVAYLALLFWDAGYGPEQLWDVTMVAVTGPLMAVLVGSLAKRARRASEWELSRARDFSSAVIASLQDGLVVRNADGRIVEVNDSFCRMTGFDRDELLRTTRPYPHWPQEEHERLRPVYDRFLAGQIAEVELVFQRKTGERFPVLLSGSLLRVEGVTRGLIVTVKDITDRKRAEQTRLELMQELQRRADELSQITAALERKNRELDQFAYIASHDLKAPLRGIANLSQWIEEDFADKLPPEARKQLELLHGRVHRMEALIEGILQYSRIGRVHFKPESVDVSRLLAEIVEMLDPPATMTIEVKPGMPTLVTEKVRLQQVFMNLMGNAIKHHDRPDGRVMVSVREVPGFYEFSVADDGPGIAAQYHGKIFVIFQTLMSRDTIEGTGLGLSLVKKIVESQGGSVSLESEEGRGSTFRFTWPK